MNNKGSAVTTAVIVVLALIIIGGGAWYFVANKPMACTQEAKICPDGTSIGRTGKNCEFAECPVADDQFKDWKTYTNTEYGFEFKYPNDWTIINNLEHGIIVADSKDINHVKFSTFVQEDDPVGSIMDVNSITSTANTAFLGKDAERYIGDGGTTGQETEIFVVKSDNLYYVINSGLNNQILSTFKFIESDLQGNSIINPNIQCKSLYWIDNQHLTCQEPKKFCGAYMYLGLQTFETQGECERVISK